MLERPGLLRSLPFGLYIGLLALDPVLRPLLPAGLDPRWLYGIRVGLVLIALILLWPRYRELTGASSVKGIEWALGAVVGAVVFVLWVNLDFHPLALPPGEGFDPRSGGELHLGLVAVRLAGAALIVPVMEELFWRSFILRWIQHPAFLSVHPGTLGLRALAVSSVLFAAEHRLWFAGLLAGLAYGWLYRRTGNLWVPILAHAVTNALLGVFVLNAGAWHLW